MAFSGLIEASQTSPSYRTESKAPSEIPSDVMADLVECYRQNSIPNDNSPDAATILSGCDTLAWVTINGNIAGVSGTIDPDIEDWSGQIPRAFYELRIGKSLQGRYERRFMIVSRGHERRGIPSMLDVELRKRHEYMYAVTRSDIPGSYKAMKDLSYIPVATYGDQDSAIFVVWINEIAKKI